MSIKFVTWHVSSAGSGAFCRSMEMNILSFIFCVGERLVMKRAPIGWEEKGRQIWFRTPRGENGNDNLVFFFLNGNLTRVGLLMFWGVYLKYLIVYKWLDCSTSRFKVWTFDSVEAGGMSHDRFHELLSATRSAVSGDAVLGCRRHITHLANMRRCHVSWVPPVGLEGGGGCQSRCLRCCWEIRCHLKNVFKEMKMSTWTQKMKGVNLKWMIYEAARGPWHRRWLTGRDLNEARSPLINENFHSFMTFHNSCIMLHEINTFR